MPTDAFSGRVWILGDNVDTDQIIPAKYLVTSDPAKLAPHFMEYTRAELASSVAPGDIIVAGRNFGCGSSREHAVTAIQGCGISAVVAKSFARIFFRNSINLGLPVVEADFEVAEGSVITIDMNSGTIEGDGKKANFARYPDFLMKIVKCGGIINYAKEALLREM